MFKKNKNSLSDKRRHIYISRSADVLLYIPDVAARLVSRF